MSAAISRKIDDVAEMTDIPMPASGKLEDAVLPADMLEDAKAGLARLATMRPDELSQLIERRVAMLNNELDARDARRAAIDAGKLAVVGQTGQLSKGTAKNLLLYKSPLKETNADIDLALQVDIQRYGDSWSKRSLGGLVLHKSKNDYLIFYIVNFRGAYQSDSGPYAIITKRSGGKGQPYLFRQLGKMKIGVSAFRLKIRKRDYKYTGLVSTDGGKKWEKLGTFALLGKTLRPGLFAEADRNAIEAIIEFGSFEIQKVEN